LNTRYMVLFKNARDSGQIRHLVRQVFTGDVKFLVDAYKKATLKKHGYLMLNFREGTPETRQVLSGILPGESTYYYVPEKKSV
jgi:hypothetical protein